MPGAGKNRVFGAQRPVISVAHGGQMILYKNDVDRALAWITRHARLGLAPALLESVELVVQVSDDVLFFGR